MRPTFENIAAMESQVGSIAHIAWRFMEGSRNPKQVLSMTEVAKIIYLNQAATKEGDPTKKEMTLAEVWDLVLAEGIQCLNPILEYLSRVSAGNNFQADLTDSVKKN